MSIYIITKLLILHALNGWGIYSENITGSLHIDSVKSIIFILASLIFEAGATGFAITACVAIAPSHKKKTFISIATVLSFCLLVLLFFSGYVYSQDSSVNLLGIFISFLAIICGIAGGGYYIWQEKLENDNKISDGLSVYMRTLAIATGCLIFITTLLLIFFSLKSRNSPENANNEAAAQENCVIKGNISLNGEKIYHMPGDKFYDITEIDTTRGEQWFCNQQQAESSGWRRSKL